MSQPYPWLAPVWDKLKASLEADRLPSALLFNAASGLGVDELIDMLGKAVMCQNYAAEACGFCHSCQLTQSGTHPDWHWVKPEKEGKSITVDQIRACNRIAQESAQLNGARLFVIEPADAMNESAANALLKTLEEPGANCVFILLTENQEKLLPTIQSRCQKWAITPPSATDATRWLKEQGVKQPEPYVLKLVSGSPLKAKAFLNDGELSQYQEFERGLVSTLTQVDSDVVSFADSCAKTPEQSLAWAWLLLTDAQKAQFSVQTSDELPGSRLFPQGSYNGLYLASQNLLKLHTQIRDHSGLNFELLFMNWLMESREAICS